LLETDFWLELGLWAVLGANGPKLPFTSTPRMLRCGPSKRPFVHLTAFELVARRPTDLFGVQKRWKGLFI
jgi:hypothetical protein